MHRPGEFDFTVTTTRRTMMNNYSEIIKINRFNLPKECSEHAGFYYEISREEASLKDVLDRKNSALSLMLANKDLYLRNHWDDSKWGKITETAIKSRISADDEVVSLQNEIADTKRKLNIATAAKTAMDHRKSMLNNLTSLLIGGFYSAPKGETRLTSADDQRMELLKKVRDDNDDGEEDRDE